MNRTFFNTTALSGDALKEAIQRAGKQDDAVLLLFKNWRKPLSPSQVMTIMQKAGKMWPLTSIRRSITTLTQKGDLVKSTGKMVKGMYGDPEHVWEINTARYPSQPEGRQAELFA